MNFTISGGLCVLLLLAPMAGVANEPDEVERELSRLQGEWQLVDYKLLELPQYSEQDLAGKFEGNLVVAGDKAETKLKIWDQELHQQYQVVIRPKLTPKEWDAVYQTDRSEERIRRYIYKIDEDKLMLSFMADPESKERPKSFAKPVKQRQTIMVWKRVSKD
jgi:uncharacterized protein (TIGR03067 family)